MAKENEELKCIVSNYKQTQKIIDKYIRLFDSDVNPD